MIEINNLTTNQIDEGFLKQIAEKVLKGEQKKEADLSLAFIGQGRMRQINKRYRAKNKVTDVLAFPESKVLLEKFKVGPTRKVAGLGEIVICIREVRKNAKRFKTPFERELGRVLIHGILHLLGQDHEKSEEKAKEMQEKETHYLNQLTIKT